MGSMNAAAMAEAVGEGQVALRPALHWHLTANIFPPVPVSMVDVCAAAVEAAAEGDWALDIELPDGVTYRGATTAPATAIVDNYHLGFFVEAEVFGDEQS